MKPQTLKRRFSTEDEIMPGSGRSWDQANKRRETVHNVTITLQEANQPPPKTVPPLQHNRKRAIVKQHCQSCLELFLPRSLVTLECHCSSQYCRICFNTWLITQFSSGRVPQCCSLPINETHFDKSLSHSNRMRFSDLREEQTAVAARLPTLYCAGCHKFIRQSLRGKPFPICPACHKATCAVCGELKVEHEGIHSMCPEVLRDPALLATAQLNGWKRCPKCRCLIEKIGGCDHVTCSRCAQSFCYRCERPLRACSCGSE